MVNSNSNDELDTNNSDSSFIEEEEVKKLNNVCFFIGLRKDDECDQIDKLDSGHYSPKSYHRLLIGIDEENIQIPEAPNKQCSNELTQKVIDFHNKMKQGMDMNKSIHSRKAFRNPSIYEKLISFCNIDEFGTNLPPEIFDPNQFREKETDHDTST